MIIWFQQLAPTNITWYHKTQDNAVRTVSAVKHTLICVRSQYNSAKTMSPQAYTPLVFCGNKNFQLQLLWTPHVEGGRKGSFWSSGNRSHQPARHGLSRPEHMHMPPLSFWQGTCSSTDPPTTSSLPLPAPPVQVSVGLQHHVGKGIDPG